MFALCRLQGIQTTSSPSGIPSRPETRPVRISAVMHRTGASGLVLRRLSLEFSRHTPVHQKGRRLRLTYRHGSGCNENGPSQRRKRTGVAGI
jgi:hypothetical protein